MKVKVLGVNIDSITYIEVLNKVRYFLVQNKQKKIFTPNPEMIVLAHNNKEFKQVLNLADIAIPDGVGLVWLTKLFKKNGIIKERVTGTDLVDGICELSAQIGSTVFFLGGINNVAERASKKLKNKYPTLNVVGAHDGGKLLFDDFGKPILSNEVENLIKLAEPAILFVAFGHNSQEQWIVQHLNQFPSIKVAIGVGGAFDFISGDIKRAPKFIRMMGLEWCWRLILQPQRIWRILTAVIVFPSLVIGERLGIIKEE